MVYIDLSSLDVFKDIKEMMMYLWFFLLKSTFNFIYKFIFFVYLINIQKKI